MTKVWPIWHPRVHAEYGESLSFFGIKITDYAKAWRFLNRDLGERTSAYAVFGDVDVLVRTYSNEAELALLENLISQNLGTISKQFLVRSEDIHYIWQQKVLPLELKTLAERDRDTLLQAALDWDSLPRADQEQLLRDNIVLGTLADPVGREMIKVFIFIGTQLASPEGILDVAKAIERIPMVEQLLVGLYTGISMGMPATTLLEISVPNADYEEILDVVNKLHETLSLARPVTTTYVAANMAWERIDRCEFLQTLDLTISRYEEKYPAMRSLTLHERLSLIDFAEQLAAVVKPDIRALRDSFINARIARDARQSREVILGIGNALEQALRDFVAHSAKEKWGADWKEILQEELKIAKPFDTLTLGGIVEANKRWIDVEPNVFLRENLVVLQEFVGLRNAAIHPSRKGDARGFESYSYADIQPLVLSALRICDSTS